MNIFNLKKRFFIFLICLLLGMAFLQILNKKSLNQDPLTKSSYFLFSEIQIASVNFQSHISKLIKKYLFLLDLREKNTELHNQNKKLKTQHQLFEETLQENKRLKRLIQLPLNKDFTLLPAQIVATDFLSQNELLTINKGSLHGIKKFMGILHPTGVVGYIFRVSPHSSQVISLLSPLSSLPARNQRSRIQGLIESYQKDLLVFNYLDKHSIFNTLNQDLKIGDKIIVTKSDQLPSGFLIGSIVSLDNSSKNLNPRAYVKPAVNFYSLEEVLVFLDFQEQILENPLKATPYSSQEKNNANKN